MVIVPFFAESGERVTGGRAAALRPELRYPACKPFEGMNVIRTPEPAALSRELRERDDPRLARRRGVVLCSFVAAGAMQVVGAYQAGLIPHLPEPPLPKLDADEVDASEESYQWFWVGDGFLGMVSYGVTAALAAAGPADRARRAPWLPLALAGKAVVDALQAARLSVDQWTRHRAFCSWCLLAAGATFAALPLTFPEAREALAELRDDRDRA